MPAGRPTKYTPETVKKIVDAIRVGATFRLACDYAGITEETFSQWRKKYSEFSDAIKEAEGAGAVGWLAKIEKAANDGSWQAAAWKLERRYPKEYGRQVVETEHSGAVTIKVVYADPDANPT
jgi:transposase